MLDHALGIVIVALGDEAAEHLAIGGGEILAAEILYDPALDSGIVALKKEEGPDQVVTDTGSSPFGGQSGNIGVGFAIPIDQASVIAQELIKTGQATHPLLGVSLSGNATDSNGNPIARVLAISPGGPADTAGIKVGDVIVAIDGQPTSGSDAVIAALRSHQPGQTVTVTVERDGARKTLSATLIDAASASG